MPALAAATLSLAMIASMVLLFFGARVTMKGEHRKQGVLMIVAGLVILANVLIWTV
ncbi:hypothetical protein ACFQPG_09565 [Sphingomonas sp. GCM10030256]|uniref:hypothetical protein n=1 Tax=Sphingomonas sp. GCM10030256 TaxID=3273427 RepID=UPI00361AA722